MKNYPNDAILNERPATTNTDADIITASNSIITQMRFGTTTTEITDIDSALLKLNCRTCRARKMHSSVSPCAAAYTELRTAHHALYYAAVDEADAAYETAFDEANAVRDAANAAARAVRDAAVDDAANAAARAVRDAAVDEAEDARSTRSY